MMPYIESFINELGYFYLEMSIYLVFGFLVAGILHLFFPDSMVRRHLGKPGLASMVKSTLLGIPLPLCSCGVIPVAASIRRSGASKGATVSFLISTPQIGADSFFLTYSLLGWVFAVVRILATIVTSIAAGIILLFTDDQEQVKPTQVGESAGNGSLNDRLKSLPEYILVELFGSIANTLLVGILLAGLIGAMLPDGFFTSYFNYPFLSMLIMLAIGVPMYVCASASTPIAASLVLKGLNPGAALVFLLTGPATNAVNLTTVSSIIGKKSTIFYLATISVSALVMGYLFNLFTMSVGLESVILHHQHEIIPMWIKWFGAGLLTIMFISYYIKKKMITQNKFSGKGQEIKQMSLKVSGMTCMHCAGSVRGAVESVAGTSNVSVDLKAGKVDFNLVNQSKLGQIKQKIKDAGFNI